MRRLFWLGLGVAVGVIVVRKITRTAESYSPSGIAHSLTDSFTGLADSLRDFVDDARTAMAEREAEILAAVQEGDDLSGAFGGDELR